MSDAFKYFARLAELVAAGDDRMGTAPAEEKGRASAARHLHLVAGRDGGDLTTVRATRPRGAPRPLAS